MYRKGIMVVETAYPYTPDALVRMPDVAMYPSSWPAEYPATVDGQLSFLRGLRAVVRQAPHNREAGVMHWEPAWLPRPAAGAHSGNGWSALALSDLRGHALPSIRWAEEPA